VDADLREAAERWLAEDPDPITRDELRALLDAGDEAAVADRFAGRLEFGTAGLRGPLRAGPNGMNAAVVSYFTSRNIRVMLSIGGITYTDDWDSALAANGTQLGTNAANLAKQLGVGIEIDYENNTSPNLAALQNFITAYRAILPYDATGANPAARLTIDLAAGDQYLVKLAAKATTDWLSTSSPVLDYANAMVPAKQPSASSAESNWQEHLTGKANYNPAIPPLAPAKFTGSLFIAEGHQVRPECTNFTSSVQSATGTWVQTAAPNGAGTTSGLLGFMFWAAEKPSRSSRSS